MGTIEHLQLEVAAARGEAEEARAAASETRENLSALSAELEFAKKQALDATAAASHRIETVELSFVTERQRFEQRLASANEAARQVGLEKGNEMVTLERVRRELEVSVQSVAVLEMRARELGEREDRLRAELTAAVAAAASAKDEADAAFDDAHDARAELEQLRNAADDVGERLDQHARESELEAAALTAERDRLVDALRASTAHLENAERRAADADARASAADGARESVAAGAKRSAKLAERELEAARQALRAANTKRADAVRSAEQARDVAKGLRIELEESRAARDAFCAEAREALAQRDEAERRAIDAVSGKRQVDEMMAAAEEALVRANAAERDAAAEVASLRKESEALARRVERQREQEHTSRRRQEVDEVVERLGLAEREVIAQTSRSALTMEGLERSVAELARGVRNGDARNSAVPASSHTPKQRMLAGAKGDENTDPVVVVDGFPTLTQPATGRYTPWFPEVDAATVSARREETVAKSPTSAGENSPGSVTAAKRNSVIADTALEAGAALAAARSVRDSRERGHSERSVSGSGRQISVVARRDAAVDTRDEFALTANARLERSREEARASLRDLRASQNTQPGDWQVRLDEIEQENERTRLRLDRARQERAAEHTPEEPQPRDVSPPQPWR